MTTERRTPEIIREEVITVDTCRPNDYGDLIVITTTGAELKVKNTRKSIISLIEENVGRAIKLGWASYMNHDYIAKAELFDGKPPVEQQVPEVKPSVDKPKPQESSGPEIGMTVKEIGDMIRTDKLKTTFGFEASVKLIEWYRARILGTTRVEFDGAKLPKYVEKQDS